MIAPLLFISHKMAEEMRADVLETVQVGMCVCVACSVHVKYDVRMMPAA